jgi:hypothetical protein
MPFRYSSHKTFAEAYAALEDFFSTGEVFSFELYGIVHKGNRWHIMLKG